MKHIVSLTVCLLTLLAVNAQTCRNFVLPRFNYNEEAMAALPEDKINYWCAYAHAAFYESDTVPSEAYLFNISQVVNKTTGEHLPADLVVDVESLNYFVYNFEQFQLQYPRGNQVLCFSTPNSAHPYLVLRSIEQMLEIAGQSL